MEKIYLFTFCFSLAIAPVAIGANSQEQVFIVKEGTSYTFPKDITSFSQDKLVLEDHASLIIPPTVKKFSLTVKKSVFGKGSKIIAKGADGDIAQHGGNGVNLNINLGIATIRGLTIVTDGGNGGAGQNGYTGINGQDANCDVLTAAQNGGDGSIGGDGGDGGSPGNVELMLSKKSDPLEISYQMNQGYAGYGGAGGKSGEPGKGKTCVKEQTITTYPDGIRGKEGKPGKPGKAGTGIGTYSVTFY